jgi:hypothetical protein
MGKRKIKAIKKNIVAIYNPRHVLRIFEILNKYDISYRLLRNTDNEIPDNLLIGKDIDIIVSYFERNRIIELLLREGMKLIPHPFRRDIKLYGVNEFDKLEDANGILLDINYEVVVHSLTDEYWIPLDKEIQLSVWKNSKNVIISGVPITLLCNEDLFIVTIARCIFDKKGFSMWHQEMLSELLLSLDVHTVIEKLELIFFKYSKRLINLIHNDDYDSIYEDYLSFKDY